MLNVIFVFVALFCFCFCLAQHSQTGPWWDENAIHPIEFLSPKNFDLVRNGSLWFTVFGYREQRYEYDKLMTFLRPFVHYGYVDASAYLDLIKNESITAIPAAKIYHGPSKVDELLPSYDSDELIQVTLSAVPSELRFVDESNFDRFFQDMYPKAIFISDKEEPTPAMKFLSHSFKNRLRMGYAYANSTDHPVAKKLYAQKLPWIVGIARDEFDLKGLVAYSGPVKGTDMGNLTLWLVNFSLREEIPDPLPANPTHAVSQITPENYKQIIEDREIATLVGYFTNGRVRALDDVVKFVKLSNAGQAENPINVAVAECDCAKHQKFCDEREVDTDPAVWLYGFPKKKIAKFDGYPNAQNLINFMRQSRGRLTSTDKELLGKPLILLRDEL